MTYFIKKLLKDKNFNIRMTKEEEELLRNNTADYAAMSYYNSGVVSKDTDQMEMTGGNVFGAYKNPYLSTNEWGWTVDAKGLRYTLNHVYQMYGKPIFIIENGSGFYEKIDENGSLVDPYRVAFFKEHIEQLRYAVEDGVEVLGYVMWGPIDIVSSGTGQMAKRYGFIYVDQDDFGNGTMKRYKKDSFYWYKKVIATNGEDLEDLGINIEKDGKLTVSKNILRSSSFECVLYGTDNSIKSVFL